MTEDLIVQITACILSIGVVTAFIIFLFKYGAKQTELQNKKTKLEIKKLEKELEEGKQND